VCFFVCEIYTKREGDGWILNIWYMGKSDKWILYKLKKSEMGLDDIYKKKKVVCVQRKDYGVIPITFKTHK